MHATSSANWLHAVCCPTTPADFFHFSLHLLSKTWVTSSPLTYMETWLSSLRINCPLNVWKLIQIRSSHDFLVMIERLTILYIQESRIVGYLEVLVDHNVPLLLNFVSITLFWANFPNWTVNQITKLVKMAASIGIWWKTLCWYIFLSS